MTKLKSEWFQVFHPNPTAKLRLICIPYAGGNASMFNSWAKGLPSDIEVISIQLPGRGMRFSTPSYDDMNLLIDGLMKEIPDILNLPYVLFGHSLGSRIGFEIIKRLNAAELKLPLHFIASGSRGPQVEMNEKPIHSLPTEEFLKELKKMNGTSDELLHNSELMNVLMPMLRADFKISETHVSTENTCFNIPLSIFGGADDTKIDLNSLNRWKELFTSLSEITIFPGGHFFIDSHTSQVLLKVKTIISNLQYNKKPSLIHE